MGNAWNGKWAGGRTYVANGKTVFVIEKTRHGRRYTTPLDAPGEREAHAKLALLERDREAFLTRAQATEGRAAEAVWRPRT